MKRAPNHIIARFVVGFLFMLASGWNSFTFLKVGFQNAWQGNFDTPAPFMWLWLGMGLVGVVMFISAGVAWDRIQDAEATSQRN
ncbi:hypothetical protein [Pseudomonas sp.]|uniref:hypothetical protein n=1 Tax=Pseudomonas sp. TaxID=306 RepID=UPI003FD84E08